MVTILKYYYRYIYGKNIEVITSMELTLDQALQKGIEAHRAGNAQEADRYYTAILKANPKHPDANHNMGVLAVGIGKVQEALPFFKAALEANPNLDQFWLSYIDALIKLERTDEAKAVFNQASGFKGDGFDQIAQRLGLSDLKKSNAQDPPKIRIESVINLHNQGQHHDPQIRKLPSYSRVSEFCDPLQYNRGRYAARKTRRSDKSFHRSDRYQTWSS